MKPQLIVLVFAITLIAACSPKSTSTTMPVTGTVDPSDIQDVSTDKTYGYESSNPINVGSIAASSRAQKEHLYLRALAGPNGESLSYNRISSCCPFETPNGMFGGGMLDKYLITWGEQTDTLYLNMYDPGDMKIPYGLSAEF